MWKRICWTLAVLLALSMAAAYTQAEGSAQFSLHSDVRFGMTIDEATEKESENGFDTERQTLTVVGYDEHGSVIEYEADGLVVRGSIAGIEGSSIEYHFDADGLLFEALYIFPNSSSIKTSLSETFQEHYTDFGDIRDALEEKYQGGSLDIPEDDPIVELIRNDALARYGKVLSDPGMAMIKEAQEFCVPMSDSGLVYVQHIRPTHTYRFDGVDADVHEYGHYLYYRYVANEELARINAAIQVNIENAQAEQEQREERIQQERENDL